LDDYRREKQNIKLVLQLCLEGVTSKLREEPKLLFRKEAKQYKTKKRKEKKRKCKINERREEKREEKNKTKQNKTKHKTEI
jgi:hypothetical protein